jgi:hypothetical protein
MPKVDDKVFKEIDPNKIRKLFDIKLYQIHPGKPEEEVPSRLDIDEYPNIMIDHEIDDEEFDMALHTLITFFAQKQYNRTVVDLEDRNRKFSDDAEEPVEEEVIKDMTLSEIEELVGHKIRIVGC